MCNLSSAGADCGVSAGVLVSSVQEQTGGAGMTRLAVLAAFLWWWVLPTSTAYAEEAVLNNPPKFVQVTKEVINRLDPSYETFWNWREGNFSQGISISLYNVKSNDIPLGSIRLGTGTGMVIYGGTGVDLPGISRRFIPASVKGIATTQPLDTLWSLVGKYGRVSLVGGYSWDDHTPAYGMTFGAAVSF